MVRHSIDLGFFLGNSRCMTSSFLHKAQPPHVHIGPTHPAHFMNTPLALAKSEYSTTQRHQSEVVAQEERALQKSRFLKT